MPTSIGTTVSQDPIVFVGNRATTMSIVDIKQESYFPFTFKLFGMVLFIFGLAIWTQNLPVIAKWLIMVGSYLSGLLMITTRYGLRFDAEKRTYFPYLWLLGWKSGKEQSYNQIEKIFINEVTKSATVQTRTGGSYNSKSKVFKAFMKLDTGEKIHLDTDKRKERLEKRVTDYERILLQ